MGRGSCVRGRRSHENACEALGNGLAGRRGHGRIGNFPPVVVYSEDEVKEYRDINIGWEQSFILSTRHFINVLKEGGEPVLTATQARDILKFSYAAEESAQKNKTIK